MRFVRDLQLRSLLISVPLYVVVILVVGSSWVVISLGVVLLLTLADIAYLTVSAARRGRTNGDDRA